MSESYWLGFTYISSTPGVINLAKFFPWSHDIWSVRLPTGQKFGSGEQWQLTLLPFYGPDHDSSPLHDWIRARSNLLLLYSWIKAGVCSCIALPPIGCAIPACAPDQAHQLDATCGGTGTAHPVCSVEHHCPTLEKLCQQSYNCAGKLYNYLLMPAESRVCNMRHIRDLWGQECWLYWAAISSVSAKNPLPQTCCPHGKALPSTEHAPT